MEGEKKRELAALREAGLAKDPNWKPWRDPVFTERLYREDYAPGSAGQNGAYTPGPYYREGLTVYALDERKNANRFTALIQEGYLHHTRHERQRTPHEELEATAQLFTAAPQMLEALRMALPTFEERAAYFGIDSEPLIAIRTAIAAATGEGK